MASIFSRFVSAYKFMDLLYQLIENKKSENTKFVPVLSIFTKIYGDAKIHKTSSQLPKRGDSNRCRIN